MYQTGESFYGPALPAPVYVAETSQVETRYYDVFFQALRDGQGQIDSVLNFAYIVAAGLVPELDRVYATGQPYYGTAVPFVTTPPDGSPPPERSYDFSYQPYREAGRLVGVSIFAHDVTEAVLARRAAIETLERQRGELQRVFEQAPMPIMVLRGPELVVESANAAISALWGRAARETVGRPYFEAVPDTAGQGFEEILAGVLATGQSTTAWV